MNPTTPLHGLQQSVPMAQFTTIGLGGAARYFLTASSEKDILDALAYTDANHLPLQVLGGGSNIVFGDRGYDGLVLRIGLLGKVFKEDGESVLVTAAAGESWDSFVVECIERGLGGVECLSGIPGSVGATPIQNVGAYGQEVSEIIVSVRAIHRPTRNVVDIAGSECRFDYRQSRFKSGEIDRYVVLAVTFRLVKNGRPAIRYAELQKYFSDKNMLGASQERGAVALRAVREAVVTLRRKKSMTVDPADPNTRSVGSFFTNPILPCEEYERLTERWIRDHADAPIPTFPAASGVKIPAAWLVEKSGFQKGFRHKGVGISQHHSLALVNYSGTTGELLELAGMIEAKVFATFAIHLEREPVVLR